MRTLTKTTPGLIRQIRRYLSNFLLLFILAIIWGCNETNTNPTCTDWDWDHENKIHGSGNLVTSERELPVFHSIKHTTVGQVNLTFGQTQEVLVTSDDNILTYVKTEVINGELVISINAPKSISDFDLIFDITITEIKKLTTSSAGNIDGQNKFYAEKVDLMLTSAGNIHLDIEADELNSGLYSAGNLFVKGSVNKHVASLYSAGNLNAFSLSTNTTYVTLNSAGNAQVNVDQFLDATLNSVGSLYYMGNPTIVQRIASIGRIYNAN